MLWQPTHFQVRWMGSWCRIVLLKTYGLFWELTQASKKHQWSIYYMSVDRPKLVKKGRLRHRDVEVYADKAFLGLALVF